MNSNMIHEDYEYVKMECDDLPKYKELFDNNNSKKSISKLKWQFCDFEDTTLNVYYALHRDSKSWAAIYAVFPVVFKVSNALVVGVQSLDTITDASHRGKGLFISLANIVYDKAKNNSIEFVYGFPNGNSVHGFSKKLNWNILDPLPFLIRPLRVKYFLSKLDKFDFFSWLPDFKLRKYKMKTFHTDYKASQISYFDNEFDLLWTKFSENVDVAIARTSRYLNWRYTKKPEEDYQIIKLTYKDVLVGLAIYTSKEKHDGKIGYIMEFMYLKEHYSEAKKLLNNICYELSINKCDAILAWCFKHSPNYKAFKRMSFFYMPEKFRPIELHFGIRVFNHVNEDILTNRESWFISYSDSDTV